MLARTPGFTAVAILTLALGIGANTAIFTIVGIVGDAKVRGAREAVRIETFVPYWQLPEPGMNVVLKTAGDPALLTVTPGDPTTMAATAALLLLVATVACFIPARRATRVDPMVALRAD